MSVRRARPFFLLVAGRGADLAIVEGEQKIRELEKRSLQRPRVFYRREPESQPFIVARPGR